MTEKTTGTDQYAAFMRRIVRTYGRKAGAGDLDTTALEQLAELREELDAQIAETVHALRTQTGGAYSWRAIGQALGMTRAAALKKYGGTEADARRVGGQPAHLR
jgi:hypothetical protein